MMTQFGAPSTEDLLTKQIFENAAQSDWDAVFELLNEYDVDVNELKDVQGRTLMDYANDQPNPEVMYSLMTEYGGKSDWTIEEKNFPVNERPTNQQLEAVETNNSNQYQEFLNYLTEVEERVRQMQVEIGLHQPIYVPSQAANQEPFKEQDSAVNKLSVQNK